MLNLGGMYFHHISNNGGIQRCHIEVNTEKSQSKPC